MADFTLISNPPLAGVDLSIGGTALKSPADLAIVALATPLGGDGSVAAAIKKAYGVALPEPGKSALSKDGARVVRLAPDQAFVIFTHPTPDAEEAVAAKIGDVAYLTDQTDVWSGLEISGAGSLAALERICPIDLHPDVFAIGDAARTVMEHLGVLIVRTGDDSYLLLSASSSAGSFLHAVETSVKNTS